MQVFLKAFIFITCSFLIVFDVAAQSKTTEQNKYLTTQLEGILVEDQKHRKMFDSVRTRYGANSEEVSVLVKAMRTTDSLNLTQVTSILDKYGWLSSEAVGTEANSTLFLVIQHADLQTQVKYLPMMRQAVKDGSAPANQLALLEDRVALRQGRKQMYGSQIGQDRNGKYFVEPIEDEQNVNKRRAAVGLQPLEEYVKHWGIDYKLPNK